MIRDLWDNNRWAFLAFVVAVTALGVFGVRTISSAIYWYDPAHQDQALAPWMTPRYVEQSYKLPRDVIEDVFFIERGVEPPRMRVGEIATRNGLTIEDLQSRLDTAHAAFEATREVERESRHNTRQDDHRDE